jgi:hypothetical protein
MGLNLSQGMDVYLCFSVFVLSWAIPMPKVSCQMSVNKILKPRKWGGIGIALVSSTTQEGLVNVTTRNQSIPYQMWYQDRNSSISNLI